MPTGQGLADLLSGAAGAPVNRPALNAFVANSQATNGLRSAQTEEALLNAQRAQEEQTAGSQLEEAFNAMPGSTPSASHLMTVAARMHAGSFVNAMDMLKAYHASVAGDPNLLNTPNQTAALQALSGKPAGPETLPNQFSLPAGINPPQTGQSPQGAANVADTQSQADLREAQAKAGGFNPHTGAQGGPMDPQAVAFGSYMLYKTGKMPAMGMGGGAARMAVLSGAAQLANQESQGQPVTNPGFDTALANGQDFTAAQRQLNSQAGGPLGNQTRSINNVVGHVQLMENLFNGLQNGDVQIANKLKAQWNKAFGSEVPTDIQTAAGFIGPELTKILSANGSAGTAEERQEFSHTAANLANSPEQTNGALGTLKNMLGRQMTDMALQYHGATGRSDFARRYVAPDVAQYLELNPDVSGQAGSVQPPGTSPIVSASPAGGAATTLPPQALQQLKEGFHTTFGNGQVWTLQNGKPVKVQ
jgi:hypothetical protein